MKNEKAPLIVPTPKSRCLCFHRRRGTLQKGLLEINGIVAVRVSRDGAAVGVCVRLVS
jgi:hypothetical protein